MKSSDGGNNLEKLAFYGESDFHNLAVGYNTETIYLYNERPNSKLQQGFYFSTNNGQEWKNSKLKRPFKYNPYIFSTSGSSECSRSKC